MELVIVEKRVTVRGLKNGKRLLTVLPSMEGAKKWLKDGGFSFEATPINLELFRKAFPEAPIPDPSPALSVARDGGRALERVLPVREPYQPRVQPYAHQRKALEKWGHLPVFAIFAEMGTGKTKMVIDKAGELWCAGKITGCLIIALKGIHEQWIDEAIPEHLGTSVKWRGHAWEQKPIPEWLFHHDKLAFFAINIDALKTQKGVDAALGFLRAHEGTVMGGIDESAAIGNASAKRTKVAYALAPFMSPRFICSGFPMTRNLVNIWAQFKFLDERIIGMRYQTTFNAEYCVTNKERKVVGAKNVEKLFARTDKFTFRVTSREALDLPPQVYDTFQFNMSDQQRKHYDELRHTFMTQLDSGEKMTVTHVATMMLRLQQITSGILTDENGVVTILDTNPRLEALETVINSHEGKQIIWARFQHDIEQIMKLLGERAVAYYGPTSPQNRREAKQLFIDRKSGIDFFVATAGAAGSGTDGLQEVCHTAIYYSNSYKADDRWQSEFRTFRSGQKETCIYTDLICRGSTDRNILRNLRAKKSLSDLFLDDIRRVLEG